MDLPPCEPLRWRLAASQPASARSIQGVTRRPASGPVSRCPDACLRTPVSSISAHPPVCLPPRSQARGPCSPLDGPEASPGVVAPRRALRPFTTTSLSAESPSVRVGGAAKWEEGAMGSAGYRTQRAARAILRRCKQAVEADTTRRRQQKERTPPERATSKRATSKRATPEGQCNKPAMSATGDVSNRAAQARRRTGVGSRTVEPINGVTVGAGRTPEPYGPERHGAARHGAKRIPGVAHALFKRSLLDPCAPVALLGGPPGPGSGL